MAKITIKKKTNYTTIDNNIFKNKNLSLKARGLLATMLSLPEKWDYTVSGLCSILKDGKSSIQSALKELEENGYLVRIQTKDENGRFSSTDYTLYEIPLTEKPLTENPPTDNPPAENQSQLNTNKSNKNKEITDKENTNNINASNSEELEGEEEEEDINAFVPDRTKRIPYLDMNNCTSDEIKNHYSIRCERIAKKYNIKDSKTIDDAASTIEYFCQKYCETFSEPHPVLSDRALERVFINFCFPPELLYENDVVTYDKYKNLIDRYFATEYGRYQLSGVVPDYSISHFMSEQILVNLCKNEFGIPHL